MKIHRSLANAVVQSLKFIFADNKYADKVIEKTLKSNSSWGARDRRFIAETTYEIVRWKRFYQEVSLSTDIDYWKWVAVYLIQKEFELPDWKELGGINRKMIRQKLTEEYSRKIQESVPDWLDDLCYSQLSDRWNKEMHSLNNQAQVVLRVNKLKTSKADLIVKLADNGIEADETENFPDALVLRKRQNIFQSQHFKNGLFEVMDAASQTIAPFLNIEPGMRVIDACAGAGGKTLHLAALSNNKGRIIALDTEQWKLDELTKRARRAGAFNIETRLIDSGKVIKRLENSADRLLLDVPCSGLGVLKRNPDAKWKLSEDFIKNVNNLQKNILNDYEVMLKKGGDLVYSTCSILPLENENVVSDFLNLHPNYKLEEEKRCWPSEGFDGFYMARLVKTSK